jgi:hypothetical protein
MLDAGDLPFNVEHPEDFFRRFLPKSNASSLHPL